MAQEIKSKRDLIDYINRMVESQNPHMRRELEGSLERTDVRLWTDGGDWSKPKNGNTDDSTESSE